jgi:hypothetical protein
MKVATSPASISEEPTIFDRRPRIEMSLRRRGLEVVTATNGCPVSSGILITRVVIHTANAG